MPTDFSKKRKKKKELFANSAFRESQEVHLLIIPPTLRRIR